MKASAAVRIRIAAARATSGALARTPTLIGLLRVTSCIGSLIDLFFEIERSGLCTLVFVPGSLCFVLIFFRGRNLKTSHRNVKSHQKNKVQRAKATTIHRAGNDSPSEIHYIKLQSHFAVPDIWLNCVGQFDAGLRIRRSLIFIKAIPPN